MKKPRRKIDEGSISDSMFADGWNQCWGQWEAYHEQEIKEAHDSYDRLAKDFAKLSDEIVDCPDIFKANEEIKALEAEVAKEKEAYTKLSMNLSGQRLKLWNKNKALEDEVKAWKKDLVHYKKMYVSECGENKALQDKIANVHYQCGKLREDVQYKLRYAVTLEQKNKALMELLERAEPYCKRSQEAVACLNRGPLADKHTQKGLDMLNKWLSDFKELKDEEKG